MKSAIHFMNKGLLLITGFLCLAIMPSCKKKKEINNARGIGIPYNNDSLMPTHPLVPSNWMIKDIRGVFIANKQTRIITDVGQHKAIYDTYWQQAIFFNHAGTVELNDKPLALSGAASTYWSSDTTMWNRNGSNTWYVGGSNNIPAIRETTNTGYPEFYGVLPDTVLRRTRAFYIFFDAGNTVNADSAFVILYSYHSNKVWFSDIVSANGGKATVEVSPYGITFLVNEYFGIGGKECFGGLLEVVLFNKEIRTVDGKSFAFIRQRQILRNIVFFR